MAYHHALASALRAGDERHTVALLQSPIPHVDGFLSTNADLLLIHNELIEQPLEKPLAKLLQQQTRVLVFGSDMQDQYLWRLVRAGVHGYLNTPAAPADIRRAVAQIMAGNAWLEHRVVRNCVCAPGPDAGQLEAKLGGNIDSMCEQLTRREKEILCQVIRGYAIKQIAAEVHLSHQGVKMHLARLFRKFGASNRNQLILAVLDRISPVQNLSATLCSGLRSNLMETTD
jgi:DNA-binding NarL/FixJ family response regulator